MVPHGHRQRHRPEVLRTAGWATWIATACVEFIFGPLVENPRRVGKPLRDELVGLQSARRGDYRVVYAIVEDTRRVEIVHIDRRSDIYR